MEPYRRIRGTTGFAGGAPLVGVLHFVNEIKEWEKYGFGGIQEGYQALANGFFLLILMIFFYGFGKNGRDASAA